MPFYVRCILLSSVLSLVFWRLGMLGMLWGFVGLLGLENLLPTSIAFEYLFVNCLPSVPGLWQLGQLLVFVGVSLARHIVLVLAM